jgi:hypothetical protein
VGLEGAGFEPVSTAFFRHRTYFVFTDAVIAVLVAVTLLPVLDTVVAAIAFACTAVVDFFK